MQLLDSPAEPSPLRYRFSRGLNLFLAKKVQLSRVAAIRTCSILNTVLSPNSQMQRRAKAKMLAARERELEIDKSAGYCLVDQTQLPEIGPAIKAAKRIYKEQSAAGDLSRYDGGKSAKRHLVYAAQGREMCQHTDIMRLALSRQVIDAVSAYLGTVPVLNNVAIMVSVPNETEKGSQLYHLDFADENQVKFFVYVDPVEEDNGPFTFVPADISRALIRELGYDRGRLQIDDVTRAIGEDGQRKMTGKAGSGFLVDTSSCLHYGSNKNTKTRLALLIQFTKHTVPEQPPIKWPAQALAEELGLDDVQTMAVTL
jgi:hypothetical protein